MQREGFLVVLSGPSSAGKSTLLERVLLKMPDLRYSVSATTRPPRPGECEGKDYFFVNEKNFRKMADTHELLEWAEYCGHLYGTPRFYVESVIAGGDVVITDVNIDGARQIREKMPFGVFVYLMPPSLDELHKRIINRGMDTEESIALRMKAAVDEIQAVIDYDYCILNDDLAKATDQLMAIIQAERCKVLRTHIPVFAW